MKRIKNICLMLVCLIVIGITYNVKADTIKYYLSAKELDYNYVNKDNAKETKIKRGDYVSVLAMLDYSEGTESYKINNGKLTIRWDNKYFNLIDYNTNNSILSNISSSSVNKESSKIVISDLNSAENIRNGKNVLVEFKFQVIDNASSGSTKIYQMDGEDNLNIVKLSDESTFKLDSLYTEMKYNVTKSSENRLSSIKIDGNSIENFSEDKTTYDVKVDSNVEKITIVATPKDSKATVSGNINEVRLKYGTNKLTINVTSESGDKKVYNLNVIREDTRSNVNTLKSLMLSSGDIVFKPEVVEYTVNVENDVEEITITSSLTDTKSKYVEDYSNKKVKLEPGSNKIQIKVLSEREEEKVYTINVNRALSTNNSLKTLKINDEKIVLVENEYTYDYEVENDVDSITISATPLDSKAKVELKDKYDLVVGENEINILVIAASGDKASYTINVTRKKILSKDSLLKSLTVKDYNINFKQDIKTYDLKAPKDVEELEITYETEDENAIVEIEGNKDLIDGSIIKVNVKAEDGTYTRYFINIEKPSGGVSPVLIIILVLLLLLGICLAIIFIRKKKNKDKKENNELEKEEQDKIEEKEELDSKEVKESSNEDTLEKEPEKPLEQKEEQEGTAEPPKEDAESIEKGAHEYIGEHEYTGDDEKKEDMK